MRLPRSASPSARRSSSPPAAFSLGQRLAAAWLRVAALNWMQRFTVLGGICGRPAVFTNSVLYFISALVLVRAIRDPAASRGL